MNKRQRITQQSYFRKAWNASNIAEQLEKLTDDLRMCTQDLNQYKKLHNEEKEKHRQYKVAYNNVSSVVDELKEATEITLKTHQHEVDSLKDLSDVQTANNQQQIRSHNEEISKMHKENEETISGLRSNYMTTITATENTSKKHQCDLKHLQNLYYIQTVTNKQQILTSNEEISKILKETTEKIADLNAKNTELKHENAEQKARTKSWRVRYEKLVCVGATALASKTVAEYGVTPDEVSLYKSFAQKQAAAAKAAKIAQDAAIEATSRGFKILGNT